MPKRNNTLRLNLLAMFIAIIILQTSIPLIGYIPIGPLAITIIPTTVVIATVLLGTVDGAIIGGVWGIITFIRAYIWPTSPLATIVFVNPIISVFPRIMIGLVAGWAYVALKKRLKRQSVSISIAAVLGSLTNTVLVLGLIYLFYKSKAPQLYQINMEKLLPYLIGVVGTNGVPEAIFSGIVTPLIATPLDRIIKRRT
ncbi:membrane protein [Lentilactobacillus fungorum]|uniref:Membrane protein n=1 Tax=Lentilactobacillus fungorum TaxID=2201250 RepID=A0ABQ3W2R0_9LACO|nr:ECF transporter S component [Lentilactobacillus fungorum]GHP14686.1 membrane protein [Lentilactobacillus fungorum]